MGALCSNPPLQCWDLGESKDVSGQGWQAKGRAGDEAVVDETTKIIAGWASRGSKGELLVMSRYKMLMGEEDVVGEGTYSICRRGIDTKTGKEVAIKVYKKKRKEDSSAAGVKLVKFRRQIGVLQELQVPFQRPADGALWTDQLSSTPPSKLFMCLVDYSKDSTGQPGPDKDDGVMYVVTELAQYSLKDYIQDCRSKKKKLSKDTVRSITKALLLVVAGLHAKGLIHLDLKPENFMVFSGTLKLIDVDGCIQVGRDISINDSSLCFSPCYCAPEWARFLIDDVEERTIPASPLLDCWSLGVTIAELVTLEAILEPTYSSFVRHGRSHQEAGYLFMEWLGGVKKAPLPKSLAQFDKDLADLLRSNLMHTEKVNRKTCAQALEHRFCNTDSAMPRRNSNPLDDGKEGDAPLTVQPQSRRRSEDTSEGIRFKGMLWKLNAGGNPANLSHWLLRDMWIAENGSLCYYSQKEEKRLVLFDGSDLSKAAISGVGFGIAKPNAFQITVDAEENEVTKAIFACDAAEDYKMWLRTLDAIQRNAMHTMQLGAGMAERMHSLKLSVRNRRMRLSGDASGYEPTFRGKLWKVKTDGDGTQEDDWFERDMWVSRNGSLVYLSKKEEKELVYYAPADLARAKLEKVPAGASCRSFAFKVVLPSQAGVEFAPGEFAAESQEMLEKWIGALQNAIDAHSKF